MASKPLPEPSGTTEAFWRACRERKLLLQRCASCAHVQYYPRAICTACMSERVEWREALGTGKVYSYSAVRRALLPGFEQDLPYVVAMIELAEGVRLLSQVVGCEPEEVFIGQAVSVVFEEAGEGIVLPKFRPLVPARGCQDPAA